MSIYSRKLGTGAFQGQLLGLKLLKVLGMEGKGVKDIKIEVPSAGVVQVVITRTLSEEEVMAMFQEVFKDKAILQEVLKEEEPPELTKELTKDKVLQETGGIEDKILFKYFPEGPSHIRPRSVQPEELRQAKEDLRLENLRKLYPGYNMEGEVYVPLATGLASLFVMAAWEEKEGEQLRLLVPTLPEENIFIGGLLECHIKDMRTGEGCTLQADFYKNAGKLVRWIDGPRSPQFGRSS